ncbi:glycosyltransferase family 2 protein [Neokomagataea tanensis]|uniref:Glycosyltransferase family 2 protein n=1 Tax=Neokomagataea tanensis TaxID=661191 RepID=A0A4Y6V1Q8_9PROT|nr:MULTISPECIES: glycosyltransferase family 2 protein [Neokomagataea]QDH23943.1 glycosyltransferase family 2 protein [Neokomagataea tanensis]
MTRAPLAIVTMVYNEPDHLPKWCNHYGRQVGPEACYIVDHGTNDGSTDGLSGFNLLKIPRSPQDDEKRTDFINQFCASLLSWYESVIYVDVDELLVADPAQYSSLTDFSKKNHHPVVTAIGVDVIHRPSFENALNDEYSLFEQRRHVRFSSAMCKPVLIRQPITWAPGFHCYSEGAPSFGDPLFLFHTRYADLNRGLKRLQRTRTQAWCSEQAGQHQRLPDQDWENMLRSMAGLPVISCSFDLQDPLILTECMAVLQSTLSRQYDRYRLDLHISGNALWHVPERFLGQL